ncbi:MAG: hypothetical protein WA715_06740 [Candidatus Acidiferrum sp.]
MPHLSQLDFFLDATTSLPVAISFDVHPDDDAGLAMLYDYEEDFRKIFKVRVEFDEDCGQNTLILAR